MTVKVGDIYPAGGKGPRFWLVVSLYDAGQVHGTRACLLGLDNLEDMNVISAQTYGACFMSRRKLVCHIDITQMRLQP